MNNYKVHDELVFHSSNGMDYKIVIVNINKCREYPYAIDMWDGNGIYAGDVMFVDEEFLDKCESK